jgi:hypothetical protein
MLAALPPASRPTGAVTISAALQIDTGALARRRLVLVAYPTRAGGCAEQTYISAVGSVAYGGFGLAGGNCRPYRCGICVAARTPARLPQAVVALVTGRADTVRVTFATDLGASQPAVSHHDYPRARPRLALLGRRVFMLIPPSGTSVLRLDALRHARVIASRTIAGLV